MALRTIFYDTETTGLKADKDRIVEIAAYDPDTEQSFVQLINPGCPIPAEVTAVHKISDEMVADAPTFSEVAEQFCAFCAGDVVLIAHNNDAFDIHFLRAEFSRCSLALPASWKFLDSLKWARRYRKDLPKHTLQFLREIYGIASNNAHRALDDVIVLYQVFKILTDDLTIDQIFSLLNQPKELTHMPFGKHQGDHLSKVPSSYIAWMKSNGAFDKAENQELRQALQKLGKL